MGNHENGKSFFEMEEVLDTVSELTRSMLINSLALNEKSIGYAEQPSPELTLYTEKNERMAVALAYHVEILREMHNKIA